MRSRHLHHSLVLVSMKFCGESLRFFMRQRHAITLANKTIKARANITDAQHHERGHREKQDVQVPSDPSTIKRL